ncbi:MULTISPECIES: LPS translocon maturation chaperone LptM [Pseudomonadaceae]|jgi:predicted small lipoprotein YifL|uniref:Lipopeptide n=2 Tax=Aquipseudomonas alcaligenes TaxID=43263 RepID=A0A142IKZ0_AQUAC|nr:MULTISPECIES: lipoprotein [Pseudomonas]HSX72208.1 lipoprotein [Pseudomonas sp.]AMR64972.1 lipopeptide [Pseudomonas alcaligenes]MBD9427099.1 lipoprotein [Pseudomonas sp. PDM15]MDC7826711.1 lipoprotein [Pseudomonas sp. BLCC-B13]MDG9922439.1 lipoprotein [Pseudomonas sp. GD04045]
MKRLLLPFIALAVFTAALAGCGQKGPLYLPDDDKTVKERDKDVFL